MNHIAGITSSQPPPFVFLTAAELAALPHVTPAPLAEQVEPTWPAMVSAAPELAECEQQARDAHPDRYREWSAVKLRFSQIVGWGASDPRLATSHHYDVVYDRLLALWERKAVRR